MLSLQSESLSYRAGDDLMHFGLTAKSNFVLGRVHVDVHFVKRNIQPQHHRGISALHQESFVAMQNRVCEYLIANITAVHKGHQMARVRKCRWGRAKETADGENALPILE